MIWGTLFIPIVTIAILLIFFKHKIVWWEPLVCFGGSFFPIIVGLIITQGRTSDTEWLTEQVIKCEHHEQWMEEWEEYIPEQGYTDDKGNYHVTVPAHWETRQCNHPEYWCKIGQTQEFYCSKEEYDRIKSIWNNEVYKDLFHWRQRHSIGDGRGDMFFILAKPDFDSIESISWTRSYENRIQASNTIVKFQELEKETIDKLYVYPIVDNNSFVNPILGYNDDISAKRLMKWNALIGPRPGPDKDYKQAGRIWVIIFNNEAYQTALDQENYWQGGNKNELNIAIGLKDGKAQWAYVFGWTKNERLKIDIRDFIVSQPKFDLLKVVDFAGENCLKSFERREFGEFSYLKIDPPKSAIITTFILSILVNVGVACFSVLNEENPESRDSVREFFNQCILYIRSRK